MERIKSKKFIKLISIGLIIAMILVIGTLYEKNETVKNFFDKYVFMKKVKEEKIPSIPIDSSDIFAYQDKILIWKDNNITVYNKYGKEEYKLDIELVNPIFNASSKYFCIAEKEGQKIYVVSGRNIIWQNSLEGKIEDVKINDNGYLAVTILGTTDKSVVTVYDNRGKELFSKHIAEDYVVDADISKDNEYLAIAKVNYAGIDIQSSIEIIPIVQAARGIYEINEYKSKLGDLILNVKYHSKNLLSCIYNNHSAIINGTEVKEIDDFENDNVMFADLNNKIVEIVKEKKNALIPTVNVKIIDNEAEDAKKYETEEPKQIYVYGDIIAINLGSEAIFINNNGWLLKEYKSSQEIHDIIITNDIAAIIYKNKIGIIPL